MCVAVCFACLSAGKDTWYEMELRL